MVERSVAHGTFTIERAYAGPPARTGSPMRFIGRLALATTAAIAFATPSEAEIMMTERTARNGEVQIFTEALGDPSDPPIVLIMGAMASKLWWPDGFVDRLAATGRYVIRYDNRDTGLSTTFPPGEGAYTIADMVDDALAVIEAHGLDGAHVVGMSLGGVIAQHLALAHPDRVATLTAIATTPLGIGGLPSMTAAYAEHAVTGEVVDWSDDARIADFLIRDAAMLAGTRHPHDAVAARELVERDLARSPSFASATNHFAVLADLAGGARAADLAVPVLVVHGTSDPIFPVTHAEAFVRAVDGAGLELIEGGGHELHAADWPQIVAALADRTRRP